MRSYTETNSYDDLGNPKTYRGYTATWDVGRYLQTYKDTRFSYDGRGRRRAKGEIKFNYDANDRLIKQSDGLEFIYDASGVAGVVYQGNTYFYQKDIFNNIAKILDANGNIIVQYVYNAWGKYKVLNANGQEIDKSDDGHIGNKNPFRYRSYYFDTETELYYLKSRYYDPELGRFITIDDISYLDPETINGLNLYAYCGNNPVINVDSTGHAPWWSWLISVLQVLGGIALCFVPGAQGVGVSLIVGGGLGLISNAVSPIIGQAIGGASSIANGWGAFSTGMSMLGLGIPGLIGGIGLMLVGGATMAFGANEIVAAATGTNYIQQWTGMSDAAYGWTYFGLNFASSIGQIAGVKYRQFKTRTAIYNPDGSVKQYRYYRSNGNKLYDIDFNHPAYGNPNIIFPHYHGWTNGGIRAQDHQSYIQLIIWLLFGGR